TKGELFTALWPGHAVVSEESLAKLVAKARAALGPAGDLIKTARKRGFLLDAAVVPVFEHESAWHAADAAAVAKLVTGSDEVAGGASPSASPVAPTTTAAPAPAAVELPVVAAAALARRRRWSAVSLLGVLALVTGAVLAV